LDLHARRVCQQIRQQPLLQLAPEGPARRHDRRRRNPASPGRRL